MDPPSSRAAAIQLVRDALLLSVSDLMRQFVRDLPVLPKDQIPLEDSCPICIVPFLEILESTETVLLEGGGQQEEEEGNERGVTKLEACGHIFCRKDLAEWIRTRHGNCPTCRSQFVPANIIPSSLYGEDDASSDGGEYIPPPEGDEDIDIDYSFDYVSSEAEYWEHDGDDDDFEPIPVVYEGFEEHRIEIEDEEMWEADHTAEEEEEIEMQREQEEENIIELEPFTDSEDEALEVEWGLTDGESNRSTGSTRTEEVHLSGGDCIVRISTNNDDESDIVEHGPYSQPSFK